VSGIVAPGAAGPGTSSPQILPAGAFEGVAGEGPLHFTARALQARLQQVFPPRQFDWHWLDGKIGKQQWGVLTRRPPAVCLGWAGVTPGAEMGEVFEAHSHWFLALVTKNAGGPGPRMLGDKLAPGILSLARAATLALNGFVIDPPDTPWAASGAVRITDVAALTSDDWVDEALAAAGVSLSVPYQEMLPPGLDTPNHFDALAITWAFDPPNGQFTQTIVGPQ
jgi:hypothetical protein